MARCFEKSSIKVPNARPVSAFVVHCSKCGTTEKVASTTNFGTVMANEVIAAKFRNMGWTLSSRGNGDVCPACQEKKRAERKEVQMVESNVVELKAEPPRVMGREDARLVLLKIDEVYLDENIGYSRGWTDRKVAEDLGVPVAWVAEVRDKHFGKEGGESALAPLLVKLKAESNLMKTEATEVRRQTKDLRAGIDAALKKVEWVAVLEDRAKDLEKRCASIATMIEEIESASAGL